MQICVTKADICDGRPGKPYLCPIARATQRVLGQKYYASVSNRIDIRQHVGAQLKLKIPFPGSVYHFVAKFDNSKPVEPFDFDIEIPEEYLCKLE